MSRTAQQYEQDRLTDSTRRERMQFRSWFFAPMSPTRIAAWFAKTKEWQQWSEANLDPKAPYALIQDQIGEALEDHYWPALSDSVISEVAEILTEMVAQ